MQSVNRRIVALFYASVGRLVGKNLSLRHVKKIGIAGVVVHTTITRKIRSTESKYTLKNSKLLKFFLVLQYHRDKAIHFPGKFHFLVK